MEEKWLDLFFGVLQSLIITGITGGIAVIITKQYLKKILFASELKSYGFQNIRATNLSDSEMQFIFQKADIIKILYVSGKNFLTINKRYFALAMHRKIPPSIQYLCAKQGTDFLHDVEKMELGYGSRSDSDCTINEDINKALAFLSNLGGKKLEIRMFNTQFRLPLILAEFHDKNGETKDIRGWLYITLPPHESKESFILSGRCSILDHFDANSEQLNFIAMMESHFDSIWKESIPYKTNQ